MVPNMAKAVNDDRYERKFQLSGLTLPQVELLVKHHPALFREIYPPRYVNNIYCDSVDMKSYFDNVAGVFERTKARVRWYGDLFGRIEEPVLELKIKNGLLGTKEFYPLHSFLIRERFSVQIIADIITISDIPETLRLKLQTLRPVLLNQYRRQYFRSADRNYRITIDTDLRFYRIDNYDNPFLHQVRDKSRIILELKYKKEMDDNVDVITNAFPFRLTKSSKYVSAIQGIYV